MAWGTEPDFGPWLKPINFTSMEICEGVSRRHSKNPPASGCDGDPPPNPEDLLSDSELSHGMLCLTIRMNDISALERFIVAECA